MSMTALLVSNEDAKKITEKLPEVVPISVLQLTEQQAGMLKLALGKK